MTVVYVNPDLNPQSVSGGVRKLHDHVALLQEAGYSALSLHHSQLAGFPFQPSDLVVFPEIYGDTMRTGVPAGIQRLSFCQNGHLLEVGVDDLRRHPYLHTPELRAILVSDHHSDMVVRAMVPPAPVFRLHLCGNGRDGHDGPFTWGAWPRQKRLAYFQHKHVETNLELVDGLELPPGWTAAAVNGSDAEVARQLQTASVFFCAAQREGCCGPLMEAMLTGPLIACWTGGEGPREYLQGRAWIAPQDDVAKLRWGIQMAVEMAENRPALAAAISETGAGWFGRTYSREREISELLAAIRPYV